MGSRRMISEQPSNAASYHAMGGQGQGQGQGQGGYLQGSHLHHNSQGQGQGQGQGPSDLNSRDSSTLAGAVLSSYNNIPCGTPRQHTPSELLNPLTHTLSSPSFTPYQPTLSTLPINPPYQPSLSTRWCQCILARPQPPLPHRVRCALG